MKIRDLIQRDLSRKIEEIIKVDQLEEHAVRQEMSEYIVTDRIRDEYLDILHAIAAAPEDPHEGVGVWISGFFGSGKSSFAKNLGYILANREIAGVRASELMKERLNDSTCSALIDSINRRIPTRVVMFDVQTHKGGTGTGSISMYMYKALLRELGYASDFNIADLEQSLEKDGAYEKFVQRFEARYQGAWSKRRKMARGMSEASAILHEMDPRTYNSPDSWATSQQAKRIEVTPGFLVEKTFELGARRAPGQAIAFIVDEVGAYVAQSTDKIEDLRSVVEHFGTKSRNLRKAREIVGPTWVVVTSQEKLDEVVRALDSKRIDLPKLQDRFKYRIDLAPADIREVASRRVLAKNETGKVELTALYEGHEGQIGRHLALENSSRKTTVDAPRFVDFYPYPPHLLELSIDIMTGIRLQPGATRHLGGSNRTIIKQAYEMLVSEKTKLGEHPVGRLVSIDRIFDLVEGNLSSERRKDISDVGQREGFGGWEVRVAKAIALLEFVRDLPRTESNLTALLHDDVRGGSGLQHVRDALERLHKAQFIRRAEDGWKLQTASEKQWDTERRRIDPRERDRAALVREVLSGVFEDPKLRRHQYGELKQLSVQLTIDGQRTGAEGQIPFVVTIVQQAADLDRGQAEVQALTRMRDHENEIHWVFALTSEIHDLVAELHASRQMRQKYDLLRSQGSLPTEFASPLAAEAHEEERYKNRLRDRLAIAFEDGTGFFRGISKDAAALGKTRTEIVRGLFDAFVPDLYPKLKMGARPVRGNEADEVLKAANLGGLPQIFYDGDAGLGLVVKEDGKLVPNAAAPIAREILDYLTHESAIGEKVSGKELEKRFTGIGYGWDREVIQLVLAVLLRAGAIEVTHQSRRFRNHSDPLCREPFTKTQAFRASTFAPRKSIGLKTLGTAAQRLEEITGREVDVEEAAIAQAFKKLAEAELAETMPLTALAGAHALPVHPLLKELEDTLRLILESVSDDCVRMLADQGSSLHTSIKYVRELRKALTPDAIAEVDVARRVLERIAPELDRRRPELRESVEELAAAIGAEDLHRRIARITELTTALDAGYGELYAAAHAARDETYETALAAVRARPDWLSLSEDVAVPLLAPLSNRVCAGLDRKRGALVCASCRATVGQMESDVAAVFAVQQHVVEKIRQLITPEEKIERVRVAEMVEGPVDSAESVEALIRALRERLLALIESGARVVVE